MLCPNAKIDIHRVLYPVVKKALSETKYIQTHDDVTALIIWWDGNINKNQLLMVLPHQRISRFPGMDVLCYKSTTFKSLNYMRSIFPKTYNFYPTTYLLPFQFSDFQKEHLKIAARTGTPITWIFKPRSGCCGKGIKLIQNSFEVSDPSNSGVIQKYVSPYLVDGYKFDFRLYLFLATANPFTVYIYNEGITRFCSQPYSAPTKENLEDQYCHLTNTAVNVKNNENSDVEICQLASTVMDKIKSNDERGVLLWSKIKEISALLMLSQYKNIMEQIRIQENENRTKQKPPLGSPAPTVPFDRKFFHIIGLDIMLDENCDPILLEMNDRPSMCVTYDLENTLKTKMIKDVLNILTIDGKPPPPNAKFGGWEPILPVDISDPFSQTVMKITNKIQQKTSSIQIVPNKKIFFPRETKFSRTRAHVNYYRLSKLPTL